MDRRQLLAGVSSSFVVGCGGGILAGGIGGATLAYDRRSLSANISYAQQGEDLVVAAIMAELGIMQPTYLDIGAADPTALSNTYLFYIWGSSGVLVEPNPAQIGALRSVRPRDKVRNVGIGFTEQAQADYFIISGSGGDLNTFSKEQAEAVVARFPDRRIERVVRLPLMTVNRVIAEHFGGRAPDFLSIDTEGLDYDILRSLDTEQFRPAIVCAEVLAMGTKADEKIVELMCSRDYMVGGKTWINVIFVDNRRLSRLGKGA